jgi:hypothetical protein
MIDAQDLPGFAEPDVLGIPMFSRGCGRILRENIR